MIKVRNIIINLFENYYSFSNHFDIENQNPILTYENLSCVTNIESTSNVHSDIELINSTTVSVSTNNEEIDDEFFKLLQSLKGGEAFYSILKSK